MVFSVLALSQKCAAEESKRRPLDGPARTREGRCGKAGRSAEELGMEKMLDNTKNAGLSEVRRGSKLGDVALGEEVAEFNSGRNSQIVEAVVF